MILGAVVVDSRVCTYEYVSYIISYISYEPTEAVFGIFSDKYANEQGEKKKSAQAN